MRSADSDCASVRHVESCDFLWCRKVDTDDGRLRARVASGTPSTTASGHREIPLAAGAQMELWHASWRLQELTWQVLGKLPVATT